MRGNLSSDPTFNRIYLCTATHSVKEKWKENHRWWALPFWSPTLRSPSLFQCKMAGGGLGEQRSFFLFVCRAPMRFGNAPLVVCKTFAQSVFFSKLFFYSWQGDERAYDHVFREANFKEYIVKIRAKMETYNVRFLSCSNTSAVYLFWLTHKFS